MPEMCHQVGIATPQQEAMNSFTLGKLAQSHIQSLLDGASEARRTRRITPRRPKHHFHWHKKVVRRPLQAGH